jgi:hypothetical protein
MSCSDSDPLWAETRNAAPMKNPIESVTAAKGPKRRSDQLYPDILVGIMQIRN